MAKIQCGVKPKDGVVDTVTQAEGGEQSDPLMPALQVLQSQLRDDERLFCRVLTGSCQCNLWDSAERVVPPLFHPHPPRKNTGLEQWHRRDAGCCTDP